MADDIDNDDKWLYGENEETIQSNLSKDESKGSTNAEPVQDNLIDSVNPLVPGDDGPPGVDDHVTENNEAEAANKDESKEEEEDGEVKQNGDDSDKDLDDDDSDDDVNIVIGDIKTTPTYTALNIKRGGLLASTAPADKNKQQQQQQPGKFSAEEFDQPGMINGVPATDYNMDAVEDQPWRKPGADITDYFNYGFNEETWKAYCERQKRLRLTESGVGLAPMNAIGLPRGPMMPIMNDNSKYSGNFLANRKAGPPPGRRMTGTIDVIVGSTQQRIAGAPGVPAKNEPPKENVIQVMTADRREYSRKTPGFPDMSVPPPAFDEYQPDYGFNPEPEPFYGGYEPTQDVQWGGEAPPNSGWAPGDVKALTPGPQPVGPPPHLMGPPMSLPHRQTSPRRDSPHRDRDRDRDRESRARSEKARDRDRDRDRERSHRRERSRSRSRRHKSKSRSPGHRSHRKKKSRRHEESD